MSGHDVRQQFVKEFRSLNGNTRRISGMIVASYILQALSAMGLGYWLLQQPVTLLTGLGIVVVMFFIGTRLRGLNNIVHECSHFTFTQRREDNVFFGSFCSSLLLWSFRDYRDEHMTHHSHCGDYEKDLDLKDKRNFKLENTLTPLMILRHALTPLFGLHVRHLPNTNLSAKDGRPYCALKIGLIAAAIVFLAIDPLAALLLVWLPFLWIFSAINYWTDCIDHGGLVGFEDDFDSSRNFIVPKQIRVFLFPRNDCYHLIHHLFPQAPSRHLDACHKQLLTHPDYRARTESFHAPDSIGDRKTMKAANKIAKLKGSVLRSYRAPNPPQPSS
jgi:fatty acid desaturase